MSKYKYITRCDHGSTRGWWVRVERIGVSRFFSDGKNGGKVKARKAALEYRDGIDVPPPRLGHQSIPGPGRVYLEWRSYRNRNGEQISYEAWSAWIRVDGRPRHTSYSVEKHGRRKAKQLATEWLEERREEQWQMLK